MKKFIVVALLIVSAGCAPYIANGYNYYCGRGGYIDIVEPQPLQIRLTCKNAGPPGVLFNGPDDPKLVTELRDYNSFDGGLGVILQDEQIMQLYAFDEGMIPVFQSLWNAPQ